MCVLNGKDKVVDSNEMELIASISRIMDNDVHKQKEVPKQRIMHSIIKIYLT